MKTKALAIAVVVLVVGSPLFVYAGGGKEKAAEPAPTQSITEVQDQQAQAIGQTVDTSRFKKAPPWTVGVTPVI